MLMTRLLTLTLLLAALAVTGCNQPKPDPAPQAAEVDKIVSILTAKDATATDTNTVAATGWEHSKARSRLAPCQPLRVS